MSADASAPGSRAPSNAGRVVAITDDSASIAARLPRAEALHRQLRPGIPAPYSNHLRRMFEEGAEMAVLAKADTVRALAAYRCHLTTFHGRRFYVDSARRSAGSAAKAAAASASPASAAAFVRAVVSRALANSFAAFEQVTSARARASSSDGRWCTYTKILKV